MIGEYVHKTVLIYSNINLALVVLGSLTRAPSDTFNYLLGTVNNTQSYLLKNVYIVKHFRLKYGNISIFESKRQSYYNHPYLHHPIKSEAVKRISIIQLKTRIQKETFHNNLLYFCTKFDKIPVLQNVHDIFE